MKFFSLRVDEEEIELLEGRMARRISFTLYFQKLNSPREIQNLRTKEIEFAA